MSVPDRLRLPLELAVDEMAAEALALPASAWVPHFNRDVYEGDWSGVALRSPGGKVGQLYPDPAPKEPFADTEILKRSPALAGALEQFRCPVTAARLLGLSPGAVIKEHRDYRLAWSDGEVRVHVALLTSEGVDFVLDGKRVDLARGQAWYLDFTRPHRVSNGSGTKRVHLVVDCVVDDWLTALVRCAGADPASG